MQVTGAEMPRRLIGFWESERFRQRATMVFMEDAERGAGLTHEHRVDVGLHLNLTTRFSMRGCSARRFRRGKMAGVTR